jgi:hypothetical protein
MKKRLKCLDDTIAEIEKEIEKNPDRFLFSTLERLKLYRDYGVDSLVEKVVRVQGENKRQLNNGFRGYGIP